MTIAGHFNRKNKARWSRRRRMQTCCANRLPRLAYRETRGQISSSFIPLSRWFAAKCGWCTWRASAEITGEG